MLLLQILEILRLVQPKLLDGCVEMRGGYSSPQAIEFTQLLFEYSQNGRNLSRAEPASVSLVQNVFPNSSCGRTLFLTSVSRDR